MSVRWVRLGDVLELQRTPVELRPDESYRRIGIYSWGKGFLHRDPAAGAAMGSMRYFTFPSGALVLSNIQAWEGAVAVAGESEARHVASNRFLPYVAIGDADVTFVAHFLNSAAGLSLLRKASPGTTVRNRTLARKLFEDSKIPLPDRDEQHRIAARLDSLERLVAETRAARESRPALADVGPRIVAWLFRRADLPLVPSRELYTTVNDIVHPGDDPAPAERFVGLEHIESHTGRRLGADPLDEQKGRKLRFAPGDVLYGYLRPYLNKVWVTDGPGLTSVEQYALRPRDSVDAHLLAHALRSSTTLDQVITATHRLQLPRIRVALLGEVLVPDVRHAPQSLLPDLEAASTHAADLVDLDRRQDQALAALLPAARNEEFSRLVAQAG